MTRFDLTDPFTRFVIKKQIEPMYTHAPPSKTHKQLLDKPPKHILVGGRIALVLEPTDEPFLWIVTISGEPKVVHELECTGLISSEHLPYG